MPIRQGGRLTSLASSCPRDSLRRRMMAPRSLRPMRWKVFLPMSMPRTAMVSLDWRGMAGLLTAANPRSTRGTAGSTAGPSHYQKDCRELRGISAVITEALVMKAEGVAEACRNRYFSCGDPGGLQAARQWLDLQF